LTAGGTSEQAFPRSNRERNVLYGGFRGLEGFYILSLVSLSGCFNMGSDLMSGMSVWWEKLRAHVNSLFDCKESYNGSII